MTQTTGAEAGAASPGPLSGVRVVDMADGLGESAGRYLADLGADVILVEPPDGAAARRAAPLHEDGTSLYFATRNAGKRGIVLDLELPADREQLVTLLDTADIWLESDRPGRPVRRGIDPAAVAARNPGLVIVSLTDFGRTGPYRNWTSTERVQLAMAGVLSRSGLPGLPPLTPPGLLATEAAAYQAAWVALLAHHQRLETGLGDHIDFSVYEAVAQTFDPGFGIGGSAVGGQRASDLPRGRPDAGALYPIFPCKDGYVRICVLSPRQWRAMRAWLGEPEEFADPRYEKLQERRRVSARIHQLIGTLFRDVAKAVLVEEGQRRGVPVAALLTLGEVLENDHFLARGALAEVEVAPGVTGRAPTGFLELDGRRAGPRHRAPRLGEHTDAVLAEVAGGTAERRPDPAAPVRPRTRRPLEGLRVLDLGVIVAGAELGRLLADQGADVIKVENRAFPDGGRQSMTGELITASFAWGHRNKRSLGLNLRDPRGVDLFKRLAAVSDVILSNFKPGTLESLGLGPAVLHEVNPGLVMAESSALGSTGPWSKRMGYGPLVRASAGLTGLWRYPEREDSFSDAITIFPDHVVGRVGATAILARLIERRRTGRGGAVGVSQAEIGLTKMAELFLKESLAPGSVTVRGNTGATDAPQGLFPCAGDDEWCAVEVRDDGDWQRLCAAIGRPDLAADARLATAAGRLAHRTEVEAAAASWLAAHPPREAMELLQAAGVPAGAMQRVADYPEDPQLAARGFFARMRQPELPDPLPTEARPALARHLPDPLLGPAPRQAAHTREVCRKVLGLTDAEIDGLLAQGVLEEEETTNGKGHL
ncbi:CaiB/BaiF CoA transferase family protein [Streptomyces acidicola]|uniref:CaiB/BaiF CoA transferase family protein n=1 Tax=Streptomyces acidicola TaxID=2596892 RepID=UPI003443540E